MALDYCAFEDEMSRPFYSETAFTEKAVIEAEHEIQRLKAEISKIKKKQEKWERKIQEIRGV